jgi:hypothetical protein
MSWWIIFEYHVAIYFLLSYRWFGKYISSSLSNDDLRGGIIKVNYHIIGIHIALVLYYLYSILYWKVTQF